MKQKFLAAKFALVVALTAGVFTTSPVQAGVPVADGVNLIQNIMSAMEAVAQTAKQIEQYQIQLQQYETMLQNTMTPPAYIWDQAQATINRLLAAQDTLSYYKNQLGSLDNYLDKFKDLDYYRSSPCFNGSGGCTPAEKAALAENRRFFSENQQKANKASFINLKMQQEELAVDARNLEKIQRGAQGATGQLEAIGYANQFASQQTYQLLQIRAMLLAQQNAITAKAVTDQDQAAREQAMEEAMTRGTFREFTPKTF